MGNIYQFVSRGKVQELTLEELKENVEVVGTQTASHLREELQGQPQVKGFLGPMWGGTKGDKNVIRYETQEVYDVLSR